MSFASRPLSAVAGAIVIALAAGTSGLASPALAAQSASTGASAASTKQVPTKPASTEQVSTTPASNTPHLATTKTEQNIRQIVQCGNTMFAVGKVWKLIQAGHTFNRDDVFSFSASYPYTMTALNPDVVGQVNSIAFVNNNCADAYIGGDFTSVDGTKAENIAEINTTTGAVVSGFSEAANNQVETLLGTGTQLLAGGLFTAIGGTRRNYFVSLSPSTGLADPYVNLHISGRLRGMSAMVYNQQLSHGGTLDLVEGNFTSVGGQARQQIFMLNLAGSTATVTGWTSPMFSHACWHTESFYVRSAAWSPDDSTIYVADTGFHPASWNKKTYPLYGLCDAAAAFPATQTSVSHEWVEYTGCDSYYSVAADDNVVYVGGHPRWADNPNACNREGSGATPDPGLQGLAAGTGQVLVPGNAEYHMSRANADSMLLIPDTTGAVAPGLWIASSNRYGSKWCQNSTGHAGICYLPYRS